MFCQLLSIERYKRQKCSLASSQSLSVWLFFLFTRYSAQRVNSFLTLPLTKFTCSPRCWPGNKQHFVLYISGMAGWVPLIPPWKRCIYFFNVRDYWFFCVLFCVKDLHHTRVKWMSSPFFFHRPSSHWFLCSPRENKKAADREKKKRRVKANDKRRTIPKLPTFDIY